MGEIEKTTGDKPKAKKNLMPVVLVCVVVVLVAVIGVLAVNLNLGKKAEDTSTADNSNVPKLGYESSVITSNQGDLQAAVEDMYKKAAEGNMALEFKNEATSTNGTDFSCYIANSNSNSYDMYLGIYEDTTYSKELMLTGLIPVGSAIDHFTTNETLSKGTHDVVLVFTQVDDDHETIHAQVSVTLSLIVS